MTSATTKGVSNHSILDINVLRSLESDVAKVAYMWARERFTHDCYGYKAEDFARKICTLNHALSHFLPMANKPYDVHIDVLHDLKNYILERASNFLFKSQTSAFTQRDDLFDLVGLTPLTTASLGE